MLLLELLHGRQGTVAPLAVGDSRPEDGGQLLVGRLRCPVINGHMIKLDHHRSELITWYIYSALYYSALHCSRKPELMKGRAVEEEQGSRLRKAAGEDVPDWWPYAAEFPQWHVWRGVSVYRSKSRVGVVPCIFAGSSRPLGCTR